ncbi:MAG: DNA gyrase/topoisomerase IV subunit A [Bacteroidales bacterium]|nr:DNA gyrase/topoisomerase IV subunit A [Bacteroidales bacterium]MDD3914950.1 DNA gyrase/topoisomerase IV subunit A [Bacteroidales bacterium]MDD4634816.1 DNA gyrase/topoisomerase IV subunit A [Bacteroidales bacterium]
MSEEINNYEQDNHKVQPQKALQVSDMFRNWYIDYASYVNLDRAVPEVDDGLKPVQRRILHSMSELDDGKYNKVANIIGNTMKYHPHGDSSIGSALVQLGQKELLIDTQGNWGNIYTGDSAAAPRYIEARLTNFAKDVVFNPKTTEWTLSYDGRNKEPVTLPIKFPLLLAQGTEGIGVGLACSILPHNFIELIDASIAYLNGEEFMLYPDFPTGGIMDCSKYKDGLRGGKIKLRSKIVKPDNKTLIITEIPYATTTDVIIKSILFANEKGKIKIKRVDDNTSKTAEIVIQLAPGVSPDKTIDALYAFTKCEISLSPNACVILNNKPHFIGVSEILKISVDRTVELLTKELEIKKGELLEQLLYASLERIFIENRIYRKIEECKTWEAVISTIDEGLEPFKPSFYREITTDDIIKLTEIKIKKISQYDLDKANERVKNMEATLKEVKADLNNIIAYSIQYYQNIKDKYGADKDRKTQISDMDTIDAVKVAATSCKLYINREDGFAGIALKKNEFVCDCSDIDDMVIIKKSGIYEIKKVADKVFIGQDVLYINVFHKKDERTIYNCVYQNGSNGCYFVKRFAITGITRDKEYDITQGVQGSKIIYLNVRPNGEAETIKVMLKPKPKLKKLSFEYDFSTLTIKSKNSKGNVLTKQAIKRIQIKDEGISTLSALKVWFDESVKRLNTDGRGTFIGDFEAEDKIFYILPDGNCRIINFDLSNHFDDIPCYINKHNPLRIYTLIYYSGEKEKTYAKRFQLSNIDVFTTALDGNPKSKLIKVMDNDHPRIALIYPDNGKTPSYDEIVELDTFIEPKGISAKGKRLTDKDFDEILILSPYYPDREILNEDVSKEDEVETPDNSTTENFNKEDTQNIQTNDDENIDNEESVQLSLF